MIVFYDAAHQNPSSGAAVSQRQAVETARLMGFRMYPLPPDFDEVGGVENVLANLGEQPPGTVGLFIGFIPLPERYGALCEAAQKRNVCMVNGLRDHRMAMEFDLFYPLISDLTFESLILNTPEQIPNALRLGFPLFIKGAIKSDKERGIKFCVAETEEELNALCLPMLQRKYSARGKVVVRRFERLRHVRTTALGFPVGREYRVFLLHGKVIASEYYWGDDDSLSPLSQDDEKEVLGLSIVTAQRLNVPFMAVDIGQTETGEWKVVETGDPQCCGFKARTALGVWAALRDEFAFPSMTPPSEEADLPLNDQLSSSQLSSSQLSSSTADNYHEPDLQPASEKSA